MGRFMFRNFVNGWSAEICASGFSFSGGSFGDKNGFPNEIHCSLPVPPKADRVKGGLIVTIEVGRNFESVGVG